MTDPEPVEPPVKFEDWVQPEVNEALSWILKLPPPPVKKE